MKTLSFLGHAVLSVALAFLTTNLIGVPETPGFSLGVTAGVVVLIGLLLLYKPITNNPTFAAMVNYIHQKQLFTRNLEDSDS